MDELRGDQATWRFDGRSVHIRYHSGRSPDRVLKALGQCEVSVPAISVVDFAARERKGRWTLRLRLAERADPYAAVGAMLTRHSKPFRLTGPAKTELLAEYWADQLTLAVDSPAGEGVVPPADAVLRLVPAVPMHVQTAEGTATFDGTKLVLVWSGSIASTRKRTAQRQEFALPDLRGIEWVPSDGWEWGYLRVLPADPPAGPHGKPRHDLHCLRGNTGKEESDELLLAATVTAHLWSRGLGQPAAAPPAHADPEGQMIYGRVRELGHLHAEGLLTDEEFATKKAELLDRL